jgi:hypothetical protein
MQRGGGDGNYEMVLAKGATVAEVTLSSVPEAVEGLWIVMAVAAPEV